MSYRSEQGRTWTGCRNLKSIGIFGLTEGLHEDEEIDGEQLAEKMAQQRATMEGTLKVLLLRGSLSLILCLLHDPAGLQGALPRTDVQAAELL